MWTLQTYAGCPLHNSQMVKSPSKCSLNFILQLNNSHRLYLILYTWKQKTWNSAFQSVTSSFMVLSSEVSVLHGIWMINFDTVTS
jgi:hypothetical protein